MTASSALGRRLRRHFLIFGTVALFLVGGFGVWGATAPIASAAIAPGQISPAGLRMTVQHLEGGIVEEILVREGQSVAAGEPLIVFDATRAEASLDYDQTQLMRVEAMKVRMEAHQAEARSLVFPPELVAAGVDDSEFAAFLAAQSDLFEGERLNLRNQLAVYDAQLLQLEAEIEGRRQEIAGTGEQLALATAEFERMNSLLDRSLAQRSQIVELERLVSEYRARQAQARSLLQQAEQRVAQLRVNMASAPDEFRRVVAEQLSTINLQLAQLRERVRSGQDVLKRTVVEAPVPGAVVNLRVNTPNAVVGPGQPVLDIVPADANLVVNARLNPIDVDIVHVGLEVEVHVLSFAARNALPITGRVTRVSADALTDPNTGAAYYEVEIALDQSTMRQQDREVLIAGMPVEVYIFTGSRTFIEYLTAPVTESFRRSFRDS